MHISASYLQEVLKVAAQAHLSDNTHLVVILKMQTSDVTRGSGLGLILAAGNSCKITLFIDPNNHRLQLQGCCELLHISPRTLPPIARPLVGSAASSGSQSAQKEEHGQDQQGKPHQELRP